METPATNAPNTYKINIKNPAMQIHNLSVWYGETQAIRDISIDIPPNKITALIGPSGCGKSTFLRSLNRMNDLIPTAKVAGEVLVKNHNIYDLSVNPVVVRRHIGMVFQKPNPFPKSIYENVAWGLRINGYKGNIDGQVEEALQGAALWDEVKDKLNDNGLSLSGGQQQRLCIARAIAIKPDIILMDEPCSALDPIATLKIEELMHQLQENYTIVIVTHNMQQASRASHYTAFFMVGQDKVGHLVEYNHTEDIFTNPNNKRTQDYIMGRFG